MKLLKPLLILLCLAISQSGYAEDPPKNIPKKDKWEETDERNISSPQLYQGDSSVYVYSEKQLDNGISCLKLSTINFTLRNI